MHNLRAGNSQFQTTEKQGSRERKLTERTLNETSQGAKESGSFETSEKAQTLTNSSASSSNSIRDSPNLRTLISEVADGWDFLYNEGNPGLEGPSHLISIAIDLSLWSISSPNSSLIPLIVTLHFFAAPFPDQIAIGF